MSGIDRLTHRSHSHWPAGAGAGAGATLGAATWGVANVSVRFHGRAALDGVSLAAAPGTVSAVVGGDGAGKSTLLRTLAGAVAPDSGRVWRPPRRQVGYLPERGGTYEDLTVQENLEFSANLYGIRREEARRRSRELLERTGLAGASTRLAGDLSGGMRQKLAVIRAMVHRPALLVLDEPSTGVDPASRRYLWWLVARAAAEGAAVVLSTTSLDEAERADSVLALDAGRVVAEGPPGVLATLRSPTPRCRAPADAAGTRAGDEVLAEARAASRRFGSAVAVDAVDLTVRAGEVVGLLGANGAGKTTLIRMLLGLLPPSGGVVHLFGQPPSRRSRARVGYVPQGLGLYEDLTPGQNARFAAAVFGASGPEALPRALQPYGGSVVGQAAGRGAGVLVTTHHMEEAGECDRLVIMADGRVVAAGSERDVVGDAEVTVVEADARADVFEGLDAAGLTVVLAGGGLRVVDGGEEAVRAALPGLPCRVSMAPATLEERFLQLVAP